MTTHPSAPAATLTVAATAAALGRSDKQVKKLLSCGLLTAEPGSPARIHQASIDRLLGSYHRPPLPDTVPVAAFHGGPLQAAPAHDPSGRSVMGYHVDPPQNLSDRDLLDAWTMWWPVGEENADRLVTGRGIMLLDVSGFVAHQPRAARRATGWTYVSGWGTRFDTEPLTPAELTLYTRRYIPSRPGALWQWVD